MKRKGFLGGIFAMALILVLTLVLSVGSVSAAEPTIVNSGNCGKDGSNVTWTLDSTGLLTISGEGEMADYYSPWYDQKESIKRVVIENGVTSIGANAFRDCTGLTSVTIPDRVTSIGYYAFNGCTGLTSVTIPDSVTSIGDYAFHDCTGLTSVTIPNSVTSIGGSAFSGCTGLKEVIYNARAAECSKYNVFQNAGTAADGMKVVFGESVEKIPSNIFSNCESLTSVTIPDSVTSIGDWVFSGCTGLKEVIYNAKAITDGSYAFKGAGTAAVGMEVIFGESVKEIPNDLFYDCAGLTSVTIPDSVTSIGAWAFYGCTGLTSVTIGRNVTSIGDNAFYGCTGLKKVIYNARAAEYSDYFAFNNAGTATDGMKVVFGESVEKIPNKLFYNCTGLTSVTIGRNVTSIGCEAFRGCTSLTEINYNARRADDLDWSTNAFYDVGAESEGVVVKFGEDVEIIPACLFCTNTSTPKIKIVSVSVGNRVTEIGKYAFCNCVNLTSLKLGNSVSTIGSEAFGCCEKLSSITGIEGVKQIGSSTFRYCSSLETFAIGENLTRIGANAFYKCIGLKEVYYNAKAAEDLESLSDVFQYAGGSGGIRVIFGENVKKIPAYLFCNARNICSFVFTGNPPTVGSSAFSDNYAYALYPVHNSEWTKSAREACGSHLTWIGYCTEPVSSAACRVDQTAYLPNDTLNTQGLCMTLTHKDGCTETIPYDSGLLELGSCDMSTPGAKTIDVTYRGTTAQLKIYVHERKTQTLDKKGYPESSHNYENNLDRTYTYKAAGAVSLDVTFSAQTEVETNIDYLYVNGAQYTGTELAGKTISIQGDTLTIRLVSDKGDSAYGFSIDRIVKTYMEHQYKNGVCTLCGAKDPNFKLAAPTVKPSYVGASGKPYLRWNAVANASKYEVYCATTENGTYTLLGTTTATNYTDNKAGSGYTYYYKVKALAANGAESDYSAVVAGICHCAKPTVKATYMGASGKPYIKWNAVANASQYEVYRATTKSGTYTLLGTTTATHYTDNKAGSGYTYYYKVKALAANGAESDYSAVVAGICHCAKPTVKATYMGASGKPYIKWNTVANASQYKVYRSTSKNGTYTLLGTTTATHYTDNKAGSGYTYYYKVRAISKVKSSANSVFSTPVAGICHCAKPTVKATYMGTTGKPYIKWNAVANASKYEVYRATSKDGTYTLLGTTTATNYTDNKAGTGYTYYYKVRAISKVKSSANSAFSTVVTGICHCARPTVKITTSAGKPRLTWNAVAGASKYEVYRATSKNGTYTKMYTTTRTSYTNTSAKAGTTYYYKVKAVSKVKSSANSVFSTAVSITVK